MSDRDCINNLQKGCNRRRNCPQHDLIEQAIEWDNRHSTLECPIISPVEEPVSNMNAWPNLCFFLNSTIKKMHHDVGEAAVISIEQRIRSTRTFLSHRQRR